MVKKTKTVDRVSIKLEPTPKPDAISAKAKDEVKEAEVSVAASTELREKIHDTPSSVHDQTSSQTQDTKTTETIVSPGSTPPVDPVVATKEAEKKASRIPTPGADNPVPLLSKVTTDMGLPVTSIYDPKAKPVSEVPLTLTEVETKSRTVKGVTLFPGPEEITDLFSLPLDFYRVDQMEVPIFATTMLDLKPHAALHTRINRNCAWCPPISEFDATYLPGTVVNTICRVMPIVIPRLPNNDAKYWNLCFSSSLRPMTFKLDKPTKHVTCATLSASDLPNITRNPDVAKPTYGSFDGLAATMSEVSNGVARDWIGKVASVSRVPDVVIGPGGTFANLDGNKTFYVCHPYYIESLKQSVDLIGKHVVIESEVSSASKDWYDDYKHSCTAAGDILKDTFDSGGRGIMRYACPKYPQGRRYWSLRSRYYSAFIKTIVRSSLIFVPFASNNNVGVRINAVNGPNVADPLSIFNGSGSDAVFVLQTRLEWFVNGGGADVYYDPPQDFWGAHLVRIALMLSLFNTFDPHFSPLARRLCGVVSDFCNIRDPDPLATFRANVPSVPWAGTKNKIFIMINRAVSITYVNHPIHRGFRRYFEEDRFVYLPTAFVDALGADIDVGLGGSRTLANNIVNSFYSNMYSELFDAVVEFTRTLTGSRGIPTGTHPFLKYHLAASEMDFWCKVLTTAESNPCCYPAGNITEVISSLELKGNPASVFMYGHAGGLRPDGSEQTTFSGYKPLQYLEAMKVLHRYHMLEIFVQCVHFVKLVFPIFSGYSRDWFRVTYLVYRMIIGKGIISWENMKPLFSEPNEQLPYLSHGEALPASLHGFYKLFSAAAHLIDNGNPAPASIDYIASRVLPFAVFKMSIAPSLVMTNQLFNWISPITGGFLFPGGSGTIIRNLPARFLGGLFIGSTTGELKLQDVPSLVAARGRDRVARAANDVDYGLEVPTWVDMPVFLTAEDSKRTGTTISEVSSVTIAQDNRTTGYQFISTSFTPRFASANTYGPAVKCQFAVGDAGGTLSPLCPIEFDVTENPRNITVRLVDVPRTLIRRVYPNGLLSRSFVVSITREQYFLPPRIGYGVKHTVG